MSTDYRSMFDRKFLAAFDLEGKDRTVTIQTVKAEALTSAGGRADKRPVVKLAETELGLVLNKTNGAVIASLYGNDTREWTGKRITLYATQASMGGKQVDCLRVRPIIPPEPKAQKAQAAS
jgi:hypothetical protein